MLLLPLPLLTLCLIGTTAFAEPQPQPQSEEPETHPSYTDDSTFEKDMLSVTNTYRQQHNASGLEWNKTLAEFAEDWSKGCEFEHSGGPYGENLAAGYGNVSAGVIAWGHERVDYNFKKGEFSKPTGHFTQLVWKSSRTVGCARHECNTKDTPGWYVVCEYFPPGNVQGAFKENVQEFVKEEGERPEGPSDARVPNGDEEEECMLGAKCNGGGKVGVGMGMLVAVVVGVSAAVGVDWW